MKFGTYFHSKNTEFDGDVYVFCFGPEIHFLDKFGKKKSQLLEMKVGTYTNSNMMNLVVMFICSTFDGKYPFWANLVRKAKTVSDKIWYLD